MGMVAPSDVNSPGRDPTRVSGMSRQDSFQHSDAKTRSVSKENCWQAHFRLTSRALSRDRASNRSVLRSPAFLRRIIMWRISLPVGLLVLSLSTFGSELFGWQAPTPAHDKVFWRAITANKFRVPPGEN